MGTATCCGQVRSNSIWRPRGGVWGGVVGGWQTLEVGVLEVGRLDVGGWLVGGVGSWIKALDAWCCRRSSKLGAYAALTGGRRLLFLQIFTLFIFRGVILTYIGHMF